MPRWRRVFGLSECQKKIKYQTRSFKGSGSSEFISISDFETHVKTTQKPTDLATILDDYQYDRCKDAEKADQDFDKKNYLKKRDVAIDLLTSLRTIMAIHKGNERQLKKELNKNVKYITDFLSLSYLEEKRASNKTIVQQNQKLVPKRLKTKRK